MESPSVSIRILSVSDQQKSAVEPSGRLMVTTQQRESPWFRDPNVAFVLWDCMKFNKITFN
jgi:hypothetical protein